MSTDLEAARRERDAALERVQELLYRVSTVQEDERHRIARNLHDHLGQQLTALRLTIAALQDPATSRDDVRSRLDALATIAARVDRDLDLIAWELRPVALHDGLHAALNAFVTEWSATRGVPAELHDSTEASPRLLPEIEAQLYRILQEALNNVAKHAGATRVSILLDRRDGDALLIVEDDGVGFDAERLTDPRRRPDGLGLATMRERAGLVGGTVRFESGPGKGTTLFVRIPVRTVPLLSPELP